MAQSPISLILVSSVIQLPVRRVWYCAQNSRSLRIISSVISGTSSRLSFRIMPYGVRCGYIHSSGKLTSMKKSRSGFLSNNSLASLELICITDTCPATETRSPMRLTISPGLSAPAFSRASASCKYSANAISASIWVGEFNSRSGYSPARPGWMKSTNNSSSSRRFNRTRACLQRM